MTKNEFLEGVCNNDLNHRILLWEALQLTTGSVTEFGSGHGSTPYLRKYCTDSLRYFKSFDNNKEWADITGATLIKDWDNIPFKTLGVLFIDHAPGERRRIDLMNYAHGTNIIVIHDTEPAADHGYQCRQHFPSFKYCVEVKTNGAWASMVSNFIDLSVCIGNGNEFYKVEAFTG